MLRLLVNGVEDYAIVLLDRAGSIVSWNTGAERITGHLSQEVVGRQFSAFVPVSERSVKREPPDGDARSTMQRDRLEQEGWQFRKDGSRFWAHVVMTAVRDEDGRSIGIAAVMQDLTRSREAERKLRDRIDLYRFPFENNPAMCVAADASGSILWINRFGAEYLGYTASELTGRSLLEIAHEDDRETVRNHLDECLQTPGRICRFESRGLRKHGDLIWVRQIVRSIREDDDEIVLLIVGDDITESKRLEAERERLLAQGRFLSKASRTLARSIDYDTALRALARLAVPVLADFAVVDVLDEDVGFRRVGVVHADPKKMALAREAQRYAPDPSLREHPVNRAIRRGRSQLIPFDAERAQALSRSSEHFRLMRRLDARFILVVPLIAHGRALGAMQFMSLAGESARDYDKADVALAEDLASRAAVAIDNARLYADAERRLREE